MAKIHRLPVPCKFNTFNTFIIFEIFIRQSSDDVRALRPANWDGEQGVYLCPC